ncbi:MAG: phage protein GemA/Gp16 family protein [Adhaeribacter sp.]
MKKRDENQNKRLHLLLGKAGLMDEKPELVSFYTNGRTTSSRELTYQEADKLIKYLESITQSKQKATAESADKMRKNIIAICYELGWIEPSDNPEERKINMAAIDSFIKQRGYLKKPLNDFTPKELPKLVSQFKQILEHSKQTAGSKATKNLLAELKIPVQPTKRK